MRVQDLEWRNWNSVSCMMDSMGRIQIDMLTNCLAIPSDLMAFCRILIGKWHLYFYSISVLIQMY